jgi:pimeloyl-ACP methyl ester carboxylesterase
MIERGYVRTAHGQVHFRAAGAWRTGRRPLVLLHQTASSSAMYEPLMTELAPDFWMFAPDTPGFGATEALPGRASIEAYAAVLLQAMDRAEIGECFLFGHHSGASIAAEIAHRAPARVARLALSGPPLLTRAELEAIVPTVCPVKLDEEGAHLLAVWRRIRAKDSSAPLDLLHREAVLNLLAGVRYPEAYEAVFAHDLASRLRGVTCPTLVVVGEEDTIRRSAEPAARLLARGRLVVFPRGGTYVCDREPAMVAGALRDFFTS